MNTAMSIMALTIALVLGLATALPSTPRSAVRLLRGGIAPMTFSEVDLDSDRNLTSLFEHNKAWAAQATGAARARDVPITHDSIVARLVLSSSIALTIDLRRRGLSSSAGAQPRIPSTSIAFRMVRRPRSYGSGARTRASMRRRSSDSARTRSLSHATSPTSSRRSTRR